MPQHRILRYFEEWLEQNRRRFLCPPKIRQRGKRFVEFRLGSISGNSLQGVATVCLR
jgi:hypothetical protein